MKDFLQAYDTRVATALDNVHKATMLFSILDQQWKQVIVDGESWSEISQADWSKAMPFISRTTSRLNATELVDAGLLITRRRKGGDGGHLPSLYRVDLRAYNSILASTGQQETLL